MKYRIVSFLLYWISRLIVMTLRMQVSGEDQIERIRRETGRGVILVAWHGRSLIPIQRFGGRDYWAMVSTSRDGEYQNQLFRRLGYNIVRGSSGAKGAIQATIALTKALKAGGVLAHTPDGPRGPSHKVQPGIVFWAQRANCPIIPAGISASPRKLLRSWDRYLLPMPFARAAFLYGEPIYIPTDAKSEEEQQLWADRVGAEMDRLEQEAERLVGAKSEA